MPIKNVAISIPEAIQAGLDRGEFSRNGNVVRNAMGQQVKHLDEVPLDFGRLQRAGAAMDAASKWGIDLVKAHPVSAITAATVGGGVVLLSAIKNKREKEAKIRERASIEDRFDASAERWMNAASQGMLTAEIVADLQESWAAYDASNKEWNIRPSRLVEALVQLMEQWNSRNGVELPRPEDESKPGDVLNLERYLEAQRGKLDESA